MYIAYCVGLVLILLSGEKQRMMAKRRWHSCYNSASSVYSFDLVVLLVASPHHLSHTILRFISYPFSPTASLLVFASSKCMCGYICCNPCECCFELSSHRKKIV